MVSAARYLGVNPWELEHQSVLWVHRAVAASKAEAHAQDMASKMGK